MTYKLRPGWTTHVEREALGRSKVTLKLGNTVVGVFHIAHYASQNPVDVIASQFMAAFEIID